MKCPCKQFLKMLLKFKAKADVEMSKNCVGIFSFFVNELSSSIYIFENLKQVCGFKEAYWYENDV